MNTSMVRTQTISGLFSRLGNVVLLSALTATTVLMTGCIKDGGGTPDLANRNVASSVSAPPQGTEQSFAVLAGSTVTNTGSSVITGNLGVNPGTAVTGFPPGLVIGGTIHAADAESLQAQNDTTTAYNNLAGQACDSDLTGQDLGGMTLVSGVYCYSSSAQLTGTLTLDAEGDSNAAWVFKTGSTLTTASNSSVLIINGGQPCNVFWQVGSSATLGTDTSFAGNILALTSITLTTGANMSGRALARNGAVTLDTNNISVAVCAAPTTTPIPPTLGKTFSPATINSGGVSTLTITLSNADATAASLTAPFIDTLPSGVVVAAAPNAGTTCGGTLTAITGASTINFTGGTIPANGSCTLTADLTAPGAGSYFNSLPAGVLQTSNGNNAAPAVATLTVNAPTSTGPPTLGKSFSPAIIIAGGVSTLTITLSNANSTIAHLTAPLIDTLPSGLMTVIGSVSSTCLKPLNEMAVQARTGGISPAWFNETTGSVGLTGGSIPANGSCTLTADVTAPVSGTYFNSLPAGALQTSNGNNAAPAVATLTVNAPTSVVPPTLGKSFSPATINAGGVSTLTITLSNADSTIAHLTAPLIDTLPTGLMTVIGSVSSTCLKPLNEIALQARTGGISPAWFNETTGSVGLTGGSIPANGSCTVTAKVTAPVKGGYVNLLSAGALQTSNGNNAALATATLTVN